MSDLRGARRCLLVLACMSVVNSRSVSAQAQSSEHRPWAGAVSALQVEKGSSRVYIKVRASGRMGHEHGVLGRLESGFIDLGREGALVFSTRSFSADTPEARLYVGLSGSVSASDRKKTTDNMLGKDVLDVGRFPTATYKITASSPLGGQTAGTPGRYKLDGTFTLHGVGRPLTLCVTVAETGTRGLLRMKGSFALVQSQFGIEPYSTLGGLIAVADKLDVWGDFILKPIPSELKPVGSAVGR
jgi:hypothetical protein